MKLLTTTSVILFSFISSFAQINSTSFATKVDFSTGAGTQNPVGIAATDFDGDGKIDIATANSAGNSISLFRNVATTGIINTSSLSAPIFATTGSTPVEIAAGDVDGDGKPDIMTTNNVGSISVLRNTSTNGNISFATKIDYTASGTNPADILLEDLNGDGKREIINTQLGTNTVSIYENLSTPGTISLQTPPINIAVSGGTANATRELTIEDINGDGKKDIVVVCYNGFVAIFRNTSSLTTISFAASVNLTGLNLNAGVSVADIDSDGKKDIAVSSYNTGVALVYKNNSTLGTISFASYISYGVGTNPHGNKLIDLDNDNRPELVVCNRGTNNVSVYRNFAVTGVINSTTYGNKRDFATGLVPIFVEFADIDADGRPEMITSNFNSNNISILKNQINPSNGLIAYYPFNGNAGDSSGFENHGTVTGAALTTDKENISNSAYSFNGSNNKITISPTYLMPNTYTYSLWMNMNAAPTSGNIASLMGIGSTISADQFLLIGNAGLSTGLGIGYGSYFAHLTTPDRYWTGSLPTTNTWYHIALARSSDSLRFYINGILVDKRPTSATAAYGSSSFEAQIGCRVGSGQFFNGKIDEVRIYNRPLSLNEVRFLAGIDTGGTIYYSKSSGNLNSLITWGTNADGSGTAPLSFDSINVTYRAVNNTSPTLGGNLRIGGANSTLVFGDGTNAFNLVIGTNDTLSCDSMFVQNNITLTNSGTLVCTKLGAANNSTVQYIRSTPQVMAAGSYGNLVASSSTKTLTENTTIKGAFGMLASINCNGFNLTLGSSAANTGLLNRSSGTIIGRFTRWFNNTTNTGATGLFPVGTATKYTPYQMAFTSAPTTGGTITCEFITGNPGNIGLPQFDFTTGAVFIDKAAVDGIWRLSGSAITGGTFNATITANSFAGVNNYADLRLIRRAQAGSWTIQGNATVNAGSNAAAIVGRIGLSTIYGEYGIGGDQSVNPLPVKLVSFTASLINNERTLLQWQTAQEFNADYFIVQRSTDQINWVDRGMVKAKGFSNTLVKYALNDAIEQTFEIIYYRLVEVDKNGKKTGSKTVSVTPTKAPEFSVFPNPAQRNIYVQGLAGEAIVYNITGLPVLTIAKDGWVNIEHLKSGLYFVKSEQKTIRLVVE